MTIRFVSIIVIKHVHSSARLMLSILVYLHLHISVFSRQLDGAFRMSGETFQRSLAAIHTSKNEYDFLRNGFRAVCCMIEWPEG